MYSSKTKIQVPFIKKSKLFWYSLITNMFVCFIKKIEWFLYCLKNRNSRTLHKKNLNLFYIYKTRSFSKNFLYSPKTEMSKLILYWPKQKLLKNSFIYLSGKNVFPNKKTDLLILTWKRTQNFLCLPKQIKPIICNY